ncbi:MAG: DJ-1/PfpI family protein [Sedimentisphaerales bacterium]
MKVPIISEASVLSPFLPSAEGRPIGYPPAGGLTKWGIAVIILAAVVAVCLGQRRSRLVPLRIVQLPEPKLTSSVSFEQALVKRQIVPRFTGQPLKFEQLGQLAWAGYGITESATGGPPAGQIRPLPGFPQARPEPGRGSGMPEESYPINLYFATLEGIYVYSPNEHSLRQASAQDVRGALARASINPEAVATAGCDIIITGSVRNSAGRSSNKVRRFMLLQAGQIAQNIQLQTVTLELAFMPVGDFDTRSVSRICNIPKNLEPLYIICIGYPATQTPTTTSLTPNGTGLPGQNRAGPKTAVLIVGRENFHDRELFETMRILGSAGVQTVIASSQTGVIRGMLGSAAEARILLNQLRVDDYDAIVFIGGLGAREYFDNPVALDIARSAAAKGKVLAAISIAPTILAHAGVLRGVRATSFFSERAALQQAGATYTNAPVERDRQIITATGPIAVVQFAGAIIEALSGR